MILVLLGTQKHQFNRAVEYVVKLAQEYKIIEPIIIQTGQVTYDLDKYRTTLENIDIKMTPYIDNYEQTIKEANYIICHAGVGVIMECLEKNKKILTIPRQAKFSEHVDDHQQEIATELEKQNYLFTANNYEQFKEKYEQLENYTFNIYETNNDKFNRKLNALLDEILGEI